MSLPEPGLAVQRADERPAITLNSGVKWERLMFWADEDVEFLEATYEPGGARAPTTRSCATAATSSGASSAGRFASSSGSTSSSSEPGDSITFPSSTPHRLSNEGAETVRAIWVVRGRRGAEPAQETSET